MKRFLVAAALVAGAILPAPTMAQETIKLGIVFPLSGGSGPQGQNTVKAIESMTAMINESGGVLGKQVELVVRDDESTPAVGVAKANELIAEGISAVIEGWNSPVSLAMQPIFNRANIFDLTSNAQADQIVSGEGNPLAVRLNSAGYLNGAATAEFIKSKGWRKLAFLVQNDAYGKGGRDALVAGLDKLGVDYEIVVEQEFPMSQLDFRGPFTSIVDAKPDAIVFWNASTGAGVPTTIRTWAQMGIDIPLVAAAGVVVESTVEQVGEAANGLFSTDFYFAETPPFDTLGNNAEFVARVRKDHGITPDKYMAMGAMAVQIWASVANEVGTLDKEPIATRIRGNVVKDTILGDAQFAENGQLLAQFYNFTVEDGKVKILD
jgi:branched-chain amino acid transport system substrate-binding protein